ncbi:unnamed protein product [Effrenium voratum]|nr:unnamed protein product [Effrenium voratum]
MDGGRRRGRRQADDDRRAERTQVFQKTKMCKFHLMGSCQRGTQCRFAHDQCELQTLPDLARTKVCKQLLQTGHCEDPHCTYAHSLEEFRVVPGFSAAEKEEADMQRAQLEQLEQMKRTGRPMDPKAQPNMLCGTPVIFVPSLQSMVPPTGDFSPFLPSSPANEKPSVMKEPPGHPGAYGAPLRLQNPQSRFFEHGAAAYMNQGGPSNGYSHPSGLDMRFPEARGFADAMPEASKAVGPRDSRGKVSGNRLRVDDDNETFNPSEPAQIKLGSLRSMSSNSLPVQVDDDDDLQDRGIPGIGMGMQMHGMGMASMPGMHGMPGMPMGMTGPSQALKVPWHTLRANKRSLQSSRSWCATMGPDHLFLGVCEGKAWNLGQKQLWGVIVVRIWSWMWMRHLRKAHVHFCKCPLRANSASIQPR